MIAPAKGAARGPAADGEPDGADAARLLVLTPASSIAFGATAPTIPAETYTRLVITSINGSQGARSEEAEVYPYKMRSWLERFFVGTRHSATLSVKVTAGSFTATVPLLTVTHDSTRGDGEVFNRVIRHQAQDFPMFLVRGSTNSDIASATFDLKGTDKVESSAAGTALSAVVAATKLVAGPPALITTLSAPAAKDVAASIDRTISALFGMSLAEEQVVDQPIRAWRGIALTLRLPREQGGWDKLKQPRAPGDTRPIKAGELDYVPVGAWTVTFDAPRVSAFATPTIACAADDAGCANGYETARKAALAELALHPTDVLAFPLLREGGPIGAVGSYLRQQEWWTGALKPLDAAGADASLFCRQIRDAMTGVGFNALDARIVADAVAKSSMVTAAAGKAMIAAGEVCVLA